MINMATVMHVAVNIVYLKYIESGSLADLGRNVFEKYASGLSTPRLGEILFDSLFVLICELFGEDAAAPSF